MREEFYAVRIVAQLLASNAFSSVYAGTHFKIFTLFRKFSAAWRTLARFLAAYSR